MAYYKKWKPSKSQAKEFAEKMQDIKVFCRENNIDYSASMDSYYFSIDGKHYRISNHSVESSYRNSHGAYHLDGRLADTVYIHASKTRLIDIYNDLIDGYTLNGNGMRI